MRSFEQEPIKAQLNDEQKALKDLESAYKKAKKDCQEKIRNLNARKKMNDPNLQTVIHQQKYQKELLKEIDGVLNDLQTNSYQSVNEFFEGSYVNGYVGSMYEFERQGIPITTPVDPKKVVTAIQTKSKLSQSYYMKQGLTVQNIRTLKKQITLECTRGIASGKSWIEVADSLTVQRCFDISRSDAMRIVRTEGNRINQQGRLDAGDEAIKQGCDLVKQWDATLDDRTRPDHQVADGQLREWDEDFLVGGEHMKAPSIGGSAKQVINCRCQLLKRPRWALDEEELKELQDRAKYFGLDKTKDFEEFKQKYLQLPMDPETGELLVEPDLISPQLPDLDNLNDPTLKNFVDRLDKIGVDYKEVKLHPIPLTEEEIIKVLAGGDNTEGSCASVGLCYVGQKGGVDVLDFRDGDSREFFATTSWLKKLRDLPDVESVGYNKYSSSVANGFQLLQKCEMGKEYYFVNGRHASIVRRIGSGKEDFEYLELQSAVKSGWTPMHSEFTSKWGNHVTSVRDTLRSRFGETKYDDFSERTFMIDVDSMKDSDELKKLLGYINTAEDKQVKGASGTIK